jgi:hypothetical protein
MGEPFAVTDCAMIAIATGEKAANLRELHDRLRRIDAPDIMYFHFWGGLLRPHFVDPEYQNDFAAWAYHSLHDRYLAERLSVINPSRFEQMADLRRQVIEVVEDRMDEPDFDPRTDGESPFFFLRGQIVVFDTGIRVDAPQQMAQRIGQMTPGSIFYHFIDARRRTASGNNDFSEWLASFGGGYAELACRICALDPYLTSLLELRAEIARVFLEGTGQGGQR